jgi:hypothetical protein
MSEKINLEAILQSEFSLCDDCHMQSEILRAMKIACQKTLELAAENAVIINDPKSYCGNTGSEYPPDQIVDKQSILNTINQIE